MPRVGYRCEQPRSALAVDRVAFGMGDNDLKALLIQRDLETGRFYFEI
jgi:hypothetical protein